MNTKQLLELRKAADLTQAAVAEALGIGIRTISGWESSDPPRELSLIEARAIHALFCPLLLDTHLSDQVDRAFAALPSEAVSIWFVEGVECKLLPTAFRLQDLAKGSRFDVPSAQCIASLVHESLTTHPLRSGVTLNLAGDAITRHKAKRYKASRAGHIFKGGVCESLLHVPAFEESASGPQPVLLLSFENKLDDKQEVIVPVPGVTQIYTVEDQILATELAEEFKLDLRPLLTLLDVLEPGQ
jgi:transcriptional regulator with XRE-family HTH domain